MSRVQVTHPLLGSSWPASTDIHCWHCCHGFKGAPIGIPHQRLKNGIYACHGVYCSWECAKAALLRDKKYYTGGTDRVSWLMHLAKNLSGRRHVETAPPKELLIKFGGPISIDEFRQPSSGPPQVLLRPPMIPLTFGNEMQPMPSWKGKSAATTEVAITITTSAPKKKRSRTKSIADYF